MFKNELFCKRDSNPPMRKVQKSTKYDPSDESITVSTPFNFAVPALVAERARRLSSLRRRLSMPCQAQTEENDYSILPLKVDTVIIVPLKLVNDVDD